MTVALAATLPAVFAGATSSTAAARVGHLARPLAAPKLYGWQLIGDRDAIGIGDIGLARFGKQLQPVWSGNGSGDTDILTTRLVSPTAHPIGPEVQVAKWATINEYPQVIAYDGGRAIVFAGLRSANSSDPYTSGTEYFETSTNGTSWSLADQQMSTGKSAYGSYGTDATVAAGQPLLAYTDGSAAAVSFHAGVEPLGTTGSTDPTTTPEPNGDVYDTGDGYDAKTGQTWAVWNSLSGRKDTEGVSAQRIGPSLGSRIHAPHAAVPSLGSYASSGVNQRMDVAERSGGGLYAAYGYGYPDATHVALWRLGASSALTMRGGANVYLADVAAAPGGRIWLFWWDNSAHRLHVARTNPAATRIGAVCTVTAPLRTTNVWSMAGNAAAGPLDLFLDAGSNIDRTSIYSRVVLPCMHVAVSPSRVARGHHVTVTVTDAGAPVAHATVALLGATLRTNSHGVAVFHVARSAARGKHVVIVHRLGYQVAKAHVRVT